MSKECRMAVKARQMMGAENIKLNPQLSKACHLDIQRYFLLFLVDLLLFSEFVRRNSVK
jgi:hypothetical protein